LQSSAFHRNNAGRTGLSQQPSLRKQTMRREAYIKECTIGASAKVMRTRC
jgi:hypothetical protein